MTKEKIWEVLMSSILEILPQCSNYDISKQSSLLEMGANSIDRMEIIALTLEHLNINIPLINVAKAENLDDVINILYSLK